MKNTKIEWTDHTFNPWIGCTKVSPGCGNCYAETLMGIRYGRVKWGKGNPRSRTGEANWRGPLRWDREAGASGTRLRIFCASLSDWLDDEAPVEWLADLLRLVRRTPNLDWQLLSKRPQNWRARLQKVVALLQDRDDHLQDPAWHMVSGWLAGEPPDNVWIGVTVEDQTRADERVAHASQIPAVIRFLSCEPLLGAVKLPGLGGQVQWVICGGETGAGAHMSQPSWVRGIRDQCKEAGVAFLFKQWGDFAPWDGAAAHRPLYGTPEASFADAPMMRVRKSRILDGREHNEFPV